jgi:hypothetical protein
MAITKIIKSSIDSNTVFRIRQEVRPDEHTIGITNLYYTDSSYANTSNTTISSNANSYIKIFGFGFQPNANIVLVPSQNTYLYSSDVTNFFENAVEVNPYYVNWGEYRAQINENAANTYPITTEYNLFLINPDGSNGVIRNQLKYSSANVFYGWTVGGNPSPTTTISSIFRYDFNNETFQNINNLSLGLSKISTITNSIYGWLIGGTESPTPTQPIRSSTNVERLSLFNDTKSLYYGKTLIKTIGGASSAKTQEYGYIIGGFSSTPSINYSSIERINLYNDSIIESPRATMSGNSFSESATVQTSSYAWIHNGVAPGTTLKSSVLRFDFSQDTSQVENRVNSSVNRGRHSAVYDTTYGWFGAGLGPSNSILSSVERITFSSDTSTLTSRGSLTQARQYVGSTQDSTYGWFFAGGQIPTSITSVSYIDRITFANDTDTATSRSDFPTSTYGTSAMSNYQV